MARIAVQKTIAVLCSFLLLGSAAPVARAQETSGREALLAAVEAARGLKSLSARVVMSGEGGFKAYVPTGEGTIRLLRQDEPVEGRAWHTRLDTTYIHVQGDPEERISTLRTPTSLIWIDHEQKEVIERRHNDTRSRSASALNLFALPELTAEDPFARELTEATGWKLHERQTVNAVLCEVVEVSYDITDPRAVRDPALSLIRTPVSKWFFAVEDHLPRRVERISDQGMISFTIVLDLHDVQVNPELTAASLEIQTPEGYTRTEPARTGEGGRPRVVAPDPAPAPAPSTTAAPQPDLPAHGFELVDAEGNPVTLESLKGSVAVLYFWGTWCVPCHEFSPLVSDLVDTFAGEPVRVFGLPVRERSEEAVREAIKPYKHTLLLDPAPDVIGCDATARAYKVRRYPTVYVIGFDSEILAVKWPEQDVTTAETMGEIEKTIRDYLASKR